MASRKTDWIIPEWNNETELPDDVKQVMYDLYIKDQDQKADLMLSYNDFFDLDLSFVTVRRKYYKKAIIFLRRDKISKLKDKINTDDKIQ